MGYYNYGFSPKIEKREISKSSKDFFNKIKGCSVFITEEKKGIKFEVRWDKEKSKFMISSKENTKKKVNDIIIDSIKKDLLSNFIKLKNFLFKIEFRAFCTFTEDNKVYIDDIYINENWLCQDDLTVLCVKSGIKTGDIIGGSYIRNFNLSEEQVRELVLKTKPNFYKANIKRLILEEPNNYLKNVCYVCRIPEIEVKEVQKYLPKSNSDITIEKHSSLIVKSNTKIRHKKTLLYKIFKSINSRIKNESFHESIQELSFNIFLKDKIVSNVIKKRKELVFKTKEKSDKFDKILKRKFYSEFFWSFYVKEIKKHKDYENMLKYHKGVSKYAKTNR